MAIKVRLRNKVLPFAKMSAAIGHVHRLSIVYLLSKDQMEMRDIAEKLGIGTSLVIHHLRILRKTGWVQKSKYGRIVLYTLNPKAFNEFLKLFPGVKVEVISSP